MASFRTFLPFGALLLLLNPCKSGAEVLQPETEVILYRERIQATAEMLQQRCPNFVKTYHLHDIGQTKRAALPLDVNVELEKSHLARLMNLLETCVANGDSVTLQPNAQSTNQRPNITHAVETTTIKNKLASIPVSSFPINGSMPLTQIPTSPSAMVKETKAPSSTLPPFAAQACMSPVNLNKFWRKDNKGQGFLGNDTEYACDTAFLSSTGYPWFRFTGEAGNKLLNSCPPHRSCGTYYGVWSDDQPKYDRVGVPYVFTAYWQHTSYGCKYNQIQMGSIKCGEGDIIYQMRTHSKTCNIEIAFCGMD